MKAIFWRGVVVLANGYEDHIDIFPRVVRNMSYQLGLPVEHVREKMVADADAELLVFGYVNKNGDQFLFEDTPRDYVTMNVRGGKLGRNQVELSYEQRRLILHYY